MESGRYGGARCGHRLSGWRARSPGRRRRGRRSGVPGPGDPRVVGRLPDVRLDQLGGGRGRRRREQRTGDGVATQLRLHGPGQLRGQLGHRRRDLPDLRGDVGGGVAGPPHGRGAALRLGLTGQPQRGEVLLVGRPSASPSGAARRRRSSAVAASSANSGPETRAASAASAAASAVAMAAAAPPAGAGVSVATASSSSRTDRSRRDRAGATGPPSHGYRRAARPDGGDAAQPSTPLQ